MIAALVSALSMIATPAHLAALVAGLLLGFLAGLTPGIGGRIGLLLALPLAVFFDPVGGAIFLISLHAVVHTSGSITPIAYGMPTSAAEAATALDGFKLQRSGRGAEALGASLSASAFGGIFGALVFVLSAPLIGPLTRYIGAPEFLVLALLGIAIVSALSDRQVAAGIALAALGVLASTVGVDGLTAAPRFSFGRLELWDGLDAIAVIGGLFVIPEMLALASSAQIAGVAKRSSGLGDMLRGMARGLTYRVILLRSSVTGVVIGMMPGVGSSVAVWIAYADASVRNRDDVAFGEGALGGVIAPEAANNAKEGGALIPTTFLGIPGSSSMAILMTGLAMLGLHPGPSFLTSQLDLAMVFAWTVVLANLAAIPIFLAVVPLITRLTALRPAAIVPFALIAIVTVAVGSATSPFSFPEFIAGGLFGLLLYLSGLPRAPFLLGFIIGPMLETSLTKTLIIFGPSAALRPGVIVLALALITVLWRLRRPAAATARVARRIPQVTLGAHGVLIAVALAAGWTSLGFAGTAGLAPGLASAVVLIATLVSLRHVLRHPDHASPPFSARTAFWFSGMLLMIPFVGLLPASILFLVATRHAFSVRNAGLATTIVLVTILQFVLIDYLFGLPLLPPYLRSLLP